MKKLLAMIAAATMAFGLCAETTSVEFKASTTGFEEWEGYDVGPFDPAAEAFWFVSGEDPVGEVKAYDEAPETGNDQYLAIDGEVPLYRTMAEFEGTAVEDMVPVDIANSDRAGIVIEQKVQFTAFDSDAETPTLEDGAKLAVWLKAGAEENAPATLMVTCAELNGDFDVVSTQSVAVTLADDAVIAENKWHTLTLTAIKAIDMGGDAGAMAGFSIAVDGKNVTAVSEDPLFPNTLAPEAGAAALITANQLFPSIAGYGKDDNMTLTSIGYKGKGAIDELKIDGMDAPAAVVTFTLNAVAGTEIVSVDGGDPAASYTAEQGATVAVVLKPADGKVFSDGADTHEVSITAEDGDLSDALAAAFAELNITVDDADTEFGGGTGTALDPYIIRTAAHLVELQTNVAAGDNFAGKYFQQTEDINGVAGFAGIGTSQGGATPFQGIYDGNGCAIRNVTLTAGEYKGIFNSIRNGQVLNLTVENVGFVAGTTGSFGCAAIAGWADGDTVISNCHVTGSVGTSTLPLTHSAAGFVINVDGVGTIIADCSFNGTINANSAKKVAGFAGMVQAKNSAAPAVNQYTMITNCTIAGTLNNAKGGGQTSAFIGYVGQNNPAPGTETVALIDCDATGLTLNVDAGSALGTIVGQADTFVKVVNVAAKADCVSVANIGVSQFPGCHDSLRYASIDGDNVIYNGIYDADFELGETYKVMVANSAPVYVFNEAGTLAFNTSLCAADLTGITAGDGFKLEDPVTVDNVTTFTAVVAPSEVTFALTAPEGTTIEKVEGATENEDGSYTAEEDADVTITLKADENKLFSDGTDTTTVKIKAAEEVTIDLGGLTVEDAAAKIGTVLYLTFDDAWNDAQENGEIVLLADCTFGTEASAQVKLNKNLTLTLNGKVLTVKNKKYDRIYVVDGKTLTVDGSVEDSKLIGTLYAGIRVSAGNYSEGNIVINGGTYVAADHNQYGLAAIQSNGGCENSSIMATDATFIGGNRLVEPTGGNRDQQGIAAVLAAGGTYTFTNCEFTGRTGIYAKAGTLTLDGCTVAANGTQFAPVANTDGSDPTGDAIIFDSNSSYNGGLELDVKGETTISSENGYAFQETVTKGSTSATLSVSIDDDATIDGEVVLSDAFAAAVKAGNASITGYAATVNNIGYQTVAAAFAAVQALEAKEEYPITVAALTADGLTITDSDRTAKIAAGVTITITKGAWAVSDSLNYAGSIDGAVTAVAIAKIDAAAITLNKDASVTITGGVVPETSFFACGAGEGYEVKKNGNVFTVGLIQVTATFVADGKTVATQTIDYGTAPEKPEDPVKDGYTFTGWNPEISEITADTEFVAQFKEDTPAYPSWIDDDPTIQGKYSKWAEDNNVTDPALAIEDAYLLNCANDAKSVENAKKAFTITSITKDAEGKWVVTTVDGANYNGVIHVRAYGTPDCKGEEIVKPTGEEGELFYQATLDVK